MGESPVLPRAARYGAAPLLGLSAVLFLQQGEQTSLALAVHGIRHSLGVSDAALGFLPLGFGVAALLGSVPFGVLADRRRRTWLLAASTAVWTATMVLCGVASSFAFLVAARLGVGLVEANSPAAISLLGDYYPVGQRARRMGYYQLGSFVGALFAYLVGSLVVQLGGWRDAFFLWVPFGILVTVLLMRQVEPRRGEQDLDFEATTSAAAHRPPAAAPHPGMASPSYPAAAASTLGGVEAVIDLTTDADLCRIAGTIALPAPRRVGCLDYRRATPRQALAEVWRIKSLRYGIVSLTVAQLMLNGLAFWGVDYFQVVHHLSVALAGLVAGILGIGAALGIVGGGYLSDRLLRRGMVNARVYVSAAGCLAGTALLLPGFDATHLAVTAPLFFVGGFMLTLPIAPTEALIADVVVCDLRGRANTIRTVVRTLSLSGPAIIGAISAVVGIRLALVAFTPLYAIGGLVMLLALRHYAWDLAFVLAETRRRPPGAGVSSGATR